MGRVRPVFGAAFALLASGCGLDDEWTAEVEPIDMGVDVRLEAVTWALGDEHLFAVGSGGVVVDDLGHRWELPGTLRDIIVIAGNSMRPARLIVVGDHGFVAIAEINGDVVGEFEIVDVGTQNDLHAVIGDRSVDLVALIVGDDTLIMASEGEQGELVWTHPPAPPDGWGTLRDVGFSGTDTPCAIGEAGRMVCAHEVALNDWVWEGVPLDTDANLTSFCGGHGHYAVGENGIVVAGDIHDNWVVMETDPAVDFVGCTSMFYYPVLVGANRTIYKWKFELEPLVTLDWEPRGTDPSWGIAIVGDSGHAGIFHITSGFILQ